MVLAACLALPGILSTPFVVREGHFSLFIEPDRGLVSVRLNGSARLGQVDGEAELVSGGVHRISRAARHSYQQDGFRDALGTGRRVVGKHFFADGVVLRQTFWLYRGTREIVTRLDVVSNSSARCKSISPVVTSAIKVDYHGRLSALFVPYDNDNYVHFRSDGWVQNEPTGSSEVSAIFEDQTRNGFVVGSIDHDTWKSGVSASKSSSGGVAQLKATSGVVSKYSHDQLPHGEVSGKEVHSARFLIGGYDDWRHGMERYGELNNRVSPRLHWARKVPFGWNSWAGHRDKVRATDGKVATDFFAMELPAFRNDGTATINLDSYWDNLSREELAEFVRHAHASGLKAGIYWTPFVAWGNLESPYGEGKYHVSDLVLKDSTGKPLARINGGLPLDPTHPGTLAEIDRKMAQFVAQGFDFVKLDFLTHGALEAAHFDPSVQTGTQAYLVGMRRLLADVEPKRIGRPFFVSLSIAPMFPHGLGHSRRISCDVFANIGASEYLLNSSNYSWWTQGTLYDFNDPDHSCLYQSQGESPTTEAEARTRLTASLVSGGMLLDGDNLTTLGAQERVKRLLSNPTVLRVARRAQVFRPVEAVPGFAPGEVFVAVQDPKHAVLGLLNCDRKQAKRFSISLERLGLKGDWKGTDAWSNSVSVVGGRVNVTVAPTDSALIELTRK